MGKILLISFLLLFVSCVLSDSNPTKKQTDPFRQTDNIMIIEYESDIFKIEIYEKNDSVNIAHIKSDILYCNTAFYFRPICSETKLYYFASGNVPFQYEEMFKTEDEAISFQIKLLESLLKDDVFYYCDFFWDVEPSR